MSRALTPVLTTNRTRLRPMEPHDFDPMWDFFQSSAASYTDPPDNRTHLWYGMLSELATWDWQGHGTWSVDLHDGTFIGQVGLNHPPHFHELELGFVFFEPFWGQSLAYEASLAARDWAFDTLKVPSFVSYIHKENARSITLAQRLGAVHDITAHSHDPDDVVYRYRRVT